MCVRNIFRKRKRNTGLSNIAKSRRRNSRGTRCSKINRTVVPAVKREIDRRKAAMIFRHVRETVTVYGRHGQMDLSKAKRSMDTNRSAIKTFRSETDLVGGYPFARAFHKPGLNLAPIDTRLNFTGRLLSSIAVRCIVIDFLNSRTPGSCIDYSRSLSGRRERERESIIPLVKIDVEAWRRRGRYMYALVRSTVTRHFVAWGQIHTSFALSIHYYLTNTEKYTGETFSWFNHVIWRFYRYLLVF